MGKEATRSLQHTCELTLSTETSLFVLLSLEFIANPAFSFSFLQPYHTQGHESSKRKPLPKEITPGIVHRFLLRLASFKQLERGIPGYHRNSEQIKLELAKRTWGQYYLS